MSLKAADYPVDFQFSNWLHVRFSGALRLASVICASKLVFKCVLVVRLRHGFVCNSAPYEYLTFLSQHAELRYKARWYFYFIFYILTFDIFGACRDPVDSFSIFLTLFWNSPFPDSFNDVIGLFIGWFSNVVSGAYAILFRIHKALLYVNFLKSSNKSTISIILIC